MVPVVLVFTFAIFTEPYEFANLSLIGDFNATDLFHVFQIKCFLELMIWKRFFSKLSHLYGLSMSRHDKLTGLELGLLQTRRKVIIHDI